MARLGTSIDIGEDIGKDKDIEVEEIKHEDVDKTTQQSLKEPKRVKIEKYGQDSIPNQILDFLAKYGTLLLIILVVAAGVWSLQQPLQLKSVEENVEQRFWQDMAGQTSLKIDVNFPLMSAAEKSRMFDREFKKIKTDPEVLNKLQNYITSAKSLFIDNNGYIYLFNREAYEEITTGPIEYIYTSLPKLTTLEHFAAILPFILGLLSILLIFFVGNELGKFGGFFAALLLAMHPSFVKHMHVGKIHPAILLIPITLVVLLVVIHLVGKHQTLKTTAFIIMFAFIALAGKPNPPGASINELINFFHPLLLPLALVAIAYMIYGLVHYPKKNFQHVALLIFGLLILLLTFFSENIITIALPIFVLFVAFCLVKAMPVVGHILEYTQLEFQKRTWDWLAVVIIGAIIFLGFMPVIIAHTPYPAMNDALFWSADFMNQPEEIPIISWHTISTQLGYYSHQPTLINARDDIGLFSKALLTTNENESASFIRQMCPDCNKVFVVVSSRNLKDLPVIINATVYEKVTLSDISQCGYQKSALVCANGYVINGETITKGRKPAELISYIDNFRKSYDGENALILFRNNEGLYSFQISSKYADIMLVRLIGQDNSFEFFKLRYRTENPEQVFVYELEI